jgi:2,4-dichlorophenol 6-monooxygenase
VLRDGRQVSTIDLAGKGRFTLLTGIGGEEWARAADEVTARIGVEIAAFVIGPGREVVDIYDDWAALREVGESGCVLIRPDLHIAWRSQELAADPVGELGRVLEALLGLQPEIAGATELTSVVEMQGS